MAPLPKRKHSSRRQGKRRAAINFKIPVLQKCSNCGFLIKPHRVCPKCGFYKGKMVLKIKDKTLSKSKKKSS